MWCFIQRQSSTQNKGLKSQRALQETIVALISCHWASNYCSLKIASRILSKIPLIIKLKEQPPIVCNWLDIHGSVWRFSDLQHSPAVRGTAVVRRSRRCRVRVLRCVGRIVLCQADCQLVAPVTCTFHWGHCKQDKSKNTQLMLESNSK